MIAIVTDLPRFYYAAAREMKNRGILFLSLGLRDEIPPTVDLIITSSSEKKKIHFPNIMVGRDAKEAVRRALQIGRTPKKSFNSIVVGIDPGKRIGIAASGDGRIIFEKIVNSPSGVVKTLNEIRGLFQSTETIVKIGSAGGSYRNRIIAALQQDITYPLELVNEIETSRPKKESKAIGVKRDILAARRIALKKGRPIARRIEVTTTSGEIKNVQRESREKTKNLTISKHLAASVVKGEIDLEEAIKIQRKERRKSLHPPR